LPDVQTVSHASPETALRERLSALIHRLELDDLELLVDIAGAIVTRRRH
jgi:hypothetical protein